MKQLIVTLIITGLFFLKAPNVLAEKIAGNSAMISYNFKSGETSDNFIKKLAIKRVLEKYSSPLTYEVDTFINTCLTYRLDCYLLPAISGLESTFGRFIYPASYNPFGWGGGYILFNDWSEGINAVGEGLRNNYINKGAISIDAIGRIYSESPTWAVRVQSIIKMFQAEEEKLQLYLNGNYVQL